MAHGCHHGSAGGGSWLAWQPYTGCTAGADVCGRGSRRNSLRNNPAATKQCSERSEFQIARTTVASAAALCATTARCQYVYPVVNMHTALPAVASVDPHRSCRHPTREPVNRRSRTPWALTPSDTGGPRCNCRSHGRGSVATRQPVRMLASGWRSGSLAPRPRRLQRLTALSPTAAARSLQGPRCERESHDGRPAHGAHRPRATNAGHTVKDHRRSITIRNDSLDRDDSIPPGVWRLPTGPATRTLVPRRPLPPLPVTRPGMHLLSV